MTSQWWIALKAVFAAAFGVQSESNHQRDFAQQSVVPFIIIALVFVIVFVISLYFFVNSLV